MDESEFDSHDRRANSMKEWSKCSFQFQTKSVDRFSCLNGLIVFLVNVNSQVFVESSEFILLSVKIKSKRGITKWMDCEFECCALKEAINVMCLPFPASVVVLDASKWACQHIISHIFIALNCWARIVQIRAAANAVVAVATATAFSITRKIKNPSRYNAQIVDAWIVLWTSVSTSAVERWPLHFCDVCLEMWNRKMSNTKNERAGRVRERRPISILLSLQIFFPVNEVFLCLQYFVYLKCDFKRHRMICVTYFSL